MTTQDLIIGHYEGTLTRAEQAKLDGLLASSPETRTLFEQHGVMEEKMKEESEELAPPFGLREATLGAALGTAASTIGGSIATWITGKFAIAVSTVVIGGAAVGLGIALSGDDEPVTKNPTSAVTTGMEEGSEELKVSSQAEEVISEDNTGEIQAPQVSSSTSSTQKQPSKTGEVSAVADTKRSEDNATKSEGPPMDLTKEDPAVIKRDARVESQSGN